MPISNLQPGCACCGCLTRVRVNGCCGLPLAGAEVTIYAGGFTEVARGLTDANGIFEFNAPGSGSYTAVASAERFATSVPVAFVLTNCLGQTVATINLLAGPGYACALRCPLPKPTSARFDIEFDVPGFDEDGNLIVLWTHSGRASFLGYDSGGGGVWAGCSTTGANVFHYDGPCRNAFITPCTGSDQEVIGSVMLGRCGLVWFEEEAGMSCLGDTVLDPIPIRKNSADPCCPTGVDWIALCCSGASDAPTVLSCEPLVATSFSVRVVEVGP
jgi:hypothetical protein